MIIVDFSRAITSTCTVTGTVDVKEDVPLKSWKEIPGPPKLSFIGTIRYFFSKSKINLMFLIG